MTSKQGRKGKRETWAEKGGHTETQNGLFRWLLGAGTPPEPALPVDLLLSSHHTTVSYSWTHVVISIKCVFKP